MELKADEQTFVALVYPQQAIGPYNLLGINFLVQPNQ
jgi:hypothetical protein